MYIQLQILNLHLLRECQILYWLLVLWNLMPNFLLGWVGSWWLPLGCTVNLAHSIKLLTCSSNWFPPRFLLNEGKIKNYEYIWLIKFPLYVCTSECYSNGSDYMLTSHALGFVRLCSICTCKNISCFPALFLNAETP